MWTDLSVSIHGETLLLDTSGAAFWPAGGALIFADLHLEKGSSYARGRQFLPPYDTEATLLRMAVAVRRFNPRRIVALGDFSMTGKRPSGFRTRRGRCWPLCAASSSGFLATMILLPRHGWAAW